MSKDHTHSGNKEDKTSITTMIHDTKRQMLEGKLVLLGDDGTPNTTTKEATVGTSYTPSNNRENGLVNVIKSDKLNDMRLVSYANLLNCEQSKKVANFRTLTAPSGNAADVAISLESVLEVKDRFENSVYGFFLGKRSLYLVVQNYVKNERSRFGRVRTMMNSKGISLFKFNSL
ncbi:hypothetical protein Tco_1285691 [Tanacetum coccineum]